MKTLLYIKPETEIYPIQGNWILDGFSEDPEKATEKNDIELDANENNMFEDCTANSLWD